MQLFLTSAVNVVAKDIAKRIETRGKKLVFIYTAAEVEEGGKLAPWCNEDRKSLVNIGFEVTDYTVSNKSKSDLENDLKDFDVIYVSGGNTFYLLQQSQKSEFVDVIRDLVINGKTYIGTSAGSIIAGSDTYPTYRIDNVKMAPDLKGYDGFGLVNFCIFPHWGSDYFKELYLNKRLDFAYKDTQVPIVMLTDRQYVWVKDGKFQIVEVK